MNDIFSIKESFKSNFEYIKMKYKDSAYTYNSRSYKMYLSGYDILPGECKINIKILNFNNELHELTAVAQLIEEESLYDHATVSIFYEGADSLISILPEFKSTLLHEINLSLFDYWISYFGIKEKGVLFTSYKLIPTNPIEKHYALNTDHQSHINLLYKKYLNFKKMKQGQLIFAIPNEILTEKLNKFKFIVETLKETTTIYPMLHYDKNIYYFDLFLLYFPTDEGGRGSRDSLLGGGISYRISGSKLSFLLMNNLEEFVVLPDNHTGISKPFSIPISKESIVEVCEKIIENKKLINLLNPPKDNFCNFLYELIAPYKHNLTHDIIETAFDELIEKHSDWRTIEEEFGELLQILRHHKSSNNNGVVMSILYNTYDSFHSNKVHVSRFKRKNTYLYIIFLTTEDSTRIEIIYSENEKNKNIFDMVSKFYFNELLPEM